MRLISLISLSFLCLMMTACVDNSARRTLEADYGVASTRLAELAGTATVQSARLQTTLDYATTRVARVATRSQFLKATLVEYGTPQSVLDAFQQQVSDGAIVLPTATPLPAVTPDTPQTAPEPSNPSASPTPPPAGGTRLANPVTALDVGDDDCASGVTDRFSPDEDAIYIVATAIDVSAGMTLTSRWSLAGEERVRLDWTPDFDIAEACIWFFIDQSDTAFTPGSWSVILDINDSPVTPPVPFIINDLTDESS